MPGLVLNQDEETAAGNGRPPVVLEPATASSTVSPLAGDRLDEEPDRADRLFVGADPLARVLPREDVAQGLCRPRRRALGKQVANFVLTGGVANAEEWCFTQIK